MKYLFSFFFLALSIPAFAQYTVSNGSSTMTDYSVAPSTGIEKVYLLNGLFQATIEYTSQASSIRFYKYRSRQSEAIEIPASDIDLFGNTYTIRNLEDMYGYFAAENGVNKSAVWIIDYNQHLPRLISISTIPNEEDCDVTLVIEKLDDLTYNTISGTSMRIEREYWLQYDNLEWNYDSLIFENISEGSLSQNPRSYGGQTIVEMPLTDTYFTITGDEFANKLGLPLQSATTPEIFTTIRTEAHFFIEQVNRSDSGSGEDATYEWTDQDEVSGTKQAVLELNLSGYGNEPTSSYFSWTIWHESDMDNWEWQTNSNEATYSLKKAGRYTLAFEAANGSRIGCGADTASIVFNIAVSKLEIPNFFSPGDPSGLYEVWKVTHESLVTFKCTIFNRWGNKVYQFNNPDEGWDGKYKGKYVSPGVYFYVIEATGADGIKYKKGGDINILRSK